MIRILPLLFLLTIITTGCSPKDRATYAAARANVDVALTAMDATAAALDREAAGHAATAATLRQQAAGIPAGPQRQALLAEAVKSEREAKEAREDATKQRDVLAKLRRILVITDAVAAGAGGDLSAALAMVPELGPYGPLVAILVAMAQAQFSQGASP
jgi:hypothetical protein